LKLPKTPFFLHFAKFGSSVCMTISGQPSILPDLCVSPFIGQD
jgi:hypothetical protein